MKKVTKTYGSQLGLSATFRQHRAESHCQYMHGYALEFKFTFVCDDDEVDKNGWVINFGGLKPLKTWLEMTFDHRTIVAEDDPKFAHFQDMEDEGLIQLVTVPGVGCEAFAEMAYKMANQLLEAGQFGDTRARLTEVEVREHGANSAIYTPGESGGRKVLRITHGATTPQEAEEMLRV